MYIDIVFSHYVNCSNVSPVKNTPVVRIVDHPILNIAPVPAIRINLVWHHAIGPVSIRASVLTVCWVSFGHPSSRPYVGA